MTLVCMTIGYSKMHWPIIIFSWNSNLPGIPWYTPKSDTLALLSVVLQIKPPLPKCAMAKSWLKNTYMIWDGGYHSRYLILALSCANQDELPLYFRCCFSSMSVHSRKNIGNAVTYVHYAWLLSMIIIHESMITYHYHFQAGLSPCFFVGERPALKGSEFCRLDRLFGATATVATLPYKTWIILWDTYKKRWNITIFNG